MDLRETEELRKRLDAGEEEAFGRYFEHHRNRLGKMVALRMDPRVWARVDPADVLQETYLEATSRLPEYLARPTMPLFLWLRFLTGQKLLQLHRTHLDTQRRDAGREISLFQSVCPEATSAALASQLIGSMTSPSQAAIRAEARARLEEALNSLDSLDREILTLRHFEHLSGPETAHVLNIELEAAKKRYARALKRLGRVLGPEDLRPEAPAARRGVDR